MAFKNWVLHTVTADTETDLISPSAATTAEFTVVTMIINNHGAAANISSTITNNTNAVQARLLSSYSLPANDTLILKDLKLMLNTDDKLRVESDSLSVSFVASGDET